MYSIVSDLFSCLNYVLIQPLTEYSEKERESEDEKGNETEYVR